MRATTLDTGPGAQPLRAFGPGRLALALAGAGAALLWLVVAVPVNHDEDQYLAASVLAGHAAPFRDFLYIQTPLQPQITGWIGLLLPGHVFLAARLLSAVLGVGTLALVWAAQRRLGVPPRRAAAAAALMACCYVFQFCFSVYRNDALPTALLSLGLLAALFALDEEARAPSWLAWAVCGLALAGAVGAKVSFAVSLGAAGLFLLIRLAAKPGGVRLGDCAGFGGGVLAGLAPCLAAWASAPEAFAYGVLGYWAHGPRDWYAANGLGFRMGLPAKVLYSAGNLALGPALAAIAVLVGAAVQRRRRGVASSPAERLLDGLIVAGLVAALIPTPTYKQYFVGVLPPLFVRLGASDFGRVGPAPRPRWMAIALGLGAMVGIGGLLFLLARPLVTGAWTTVQVARENRWIGERLRAAGARGVVSTLSPRVVLDSGFSLDPRFATGVNVYRTADALSPTLRATLKVTSPRSLVADFDARPPAAIVVGYEGGRGDMPIDLDGPLRAYAQSRGYLGQRSLVGAAELYIRPVGAR